MALKSQDVLVALKLLSDGERRSPFAALASELGMSASEVHGAVGRLREGRLVSAEGRSVMRKALREFLVYGVSHVFPAKEGEPARGLPTSWAVSLSDGAVGEDVDAVPVWAYPKGTVRGPSVTPLYRSAPQAALADPKLYRLLALVDTLRLGRARERKAAIAEIDKHLLGDG